VERGRWPWIQEGSEAELQDLLPLPPEPFGYALSRRGERVAAEPVPWTQPGWDGIGYEEA